MSKLLDTSSLIVASITLLLFLAALFAKGLTHDLFLESGVFLVSVKIIMMAHRNRVETRKLDEKLDKVLEAVDRADARREHGETPPRTDGGGTPPR
jgi:hypothetical protein